MASPSLNYVWQYVPEGHEKALKQAFYNILANVFILFAVAAVIAVYFVLSPFLRPLCWALLCGTFLYPFKRSITDILRNWLRSLSLSGTPFFVGVVILPIQIATNVTDCFSDLIWRNIAVILAIFVGFPLLQFIYHFGPLCNVARFLLSFFSFLNDFVCYFSNFWINYERNKLSHALFGMYKYTLIWVSELIMGFLDVELLPFQARFTQHFSEIVVEVKASGPPQILKVLRISKGMLPVWSLLVAYFGAVAFFWRPISHGFLSKLAIPVWLVVVFNIASSAGLLRVPLLVVMVTLMVVGSLAEIKSLDFQLSISNDRGMWFPISAIQALLVSRSCASKSDSDAGFNVNSSDKEYSSITGNVDVEDLTRETPIPDISVLPGSCGIITKPSLLDVKSQHIDRRKETPFTVRCFQFVLWSHVLVRLWMHSWLILILLLLPLVHLGFKKIGARKLLEEVWSHTIKYLQPRFIVRQDALIPTSVRGVAKLIMRGDRKVMAFLESSLDSATSTLMILALLIGTSIFTMVGFIQVQKESMHIVTLSSNLFNSTVNRDLSRWLPGELAMQHTVDTVVDKAYSYGRDIIKHKVKDLLSGYGDTNVTLVELQILETWDQIYEKWLSKNTSSDVPVFTVPDVNNIWMLWDTVSHGAHLLNLSKLTAFAQEHIGTFLSVLESVWVVVCGNMALIISILTSTVSVVFGGGTAILNFVLSAVIFLTTLFYLLASSGRNYKPVEFFTSISPSVGLSTPSSPTTTTPASLSNSNHGSRFGRAVEQAISGVFMASLKMSAFYGLWTWLIHLVFGLNIIFIPSALAAVFAAVPFVGAYWACLPGVLDLWLIQGHGLASVAFFFAHMVPSYVVDTAIYGEIKEGHPFLTGLAIAGGMYCMGLEGAILGPILLCCLIVLINMYGHMLNSDISPAGGM